MKKHYKILLMMVVMSTSVLFFSCGDDQPLPFRVFVGGQDVLDTMNTGLVLPTVWINGESAHMKGTEQDNTNQFINDITFKNGHYYATGYENTSNGWVTKVWKDNNLIHTFSQTNTTQWGNAIAVSGGDVYVAGIKSDFSIERTMAVVYKNSSITVLNSNSEVSAQATSIIFSDEGDMYVGGRENNEACYWKNEEITMLPDGSGYEVNSIAVVGTDVYALGYCTSCFGAQVRYWKNGVTVDVTSLSEGAYGHSMAVSGTDVYVAGADFVDNKWRARLWKNGVGTTLTPEGVIGWARDVLIDGTTVYVVGEQRSGLVWNYAMLWTDGVPTELGTRRSRAFAVAISD